MIDDMLEIVLDQQFPPDPSSYVKSAQGKNDFELIYSENQNKQDR